ncbi:uncharacterized protein pprc1 [Alosa pseudoharengus]|uniref:uncharacterized protein pprc1 n=1 Tax=Alosa pseudoharengus TaxID=34774 RepID=UPI003F8A22B5
MAARWGTGEEILTTHNMEFFSTTSLDEAETLQGALVVDCIEDQGLHAGDVVEALHGCLDPSILSIFEDSPTGEAKIGIDEESEANLLTALTEVLDNVDDENLSPFDMLPDVELLTGQKGREHSPLRKLFCLSRSPPDRESMFNSRAFSSPGKSLPRMPSVTIQRSDGEDEEEMAHLSDIEPSVDLLDWSSVSLEQDGSCVAVTLGDLVKHMHCMAVCLEDGTGEQMLPEGGIVLEVVDQGEHGEPILAIPDLSLELPDSGSKQEVPDQTPTVGQEHPAPEADTPVDAVEPAGSPPPLLEDQEEKVVIKRPKEEMTEKCPSRRKKKRKNKEAQPLPVSEGRVLRSTTKDLTKKTQEQQELQKRKKKVTFAPVVSTTLASEVATTPKATLADHPQVTPQTPIHKNPAPTCDELRMDASAPKASPAPASPPVPAPSPVPVPVIAPSATSPVPVSACAQEKAPEEPVVAPAPNEPKPKPLSLQQYRLLRQQKRPAPLEKAGDNSTKWPSLPEPPKELPLIPCLPQPSPKDPRNLAAAKEPFPVEKPVWQPKGLAAPPTPEALLVPPASLVAASSKPAVPKPVSVQPSPASTPSPTLAPTSTPSPSLAPTSTPNPSPAPVAVPSPAPIPTLQPQGQTSVAASQNTTTSDAPLHATPPAPLQAAVYKTAPLPSATTPTASQVLQAIVSQPHIAQLLAAALKGQKLPLVLPQVRSNALTPQTQSDVYPRTTTEAQPAAAAAAVAASAASTPQKVVATPAAAVSVAPLQAQKKPEQIVVSPKPEPVKVTQPLQRQAPVAAAVPTNPSVVAAQSQRKALPVQPKQTPVVAPPKGKSQTDELIESFTSEIGIEASDLASLLEQFEETQAKVERSVPEVFGRAAAVGNSSVETTMESKPLEGTKVHDLGSTAGLTPPGTPPHQMWKPLVPAVLQGKSKMADGTKQTPTKLTIQIEPRPLPSSKLRGKVQPSAAAFQPFSPDHDYCLPSKESSSEVGKRWNIKQQSSITIKTIDLPSEVKVSRQPLTQCPQVASVCSKPSGAPRPLDEQALASSVLVTPDASPSRVEPEVARTRSPKRECSSGRGLRSPSPCCRKRGRARRRQSDHSRSSSSGSSSRSSSRSQSRSPPRKRCYRSHRSESTSSSRSRSRSRSRSESHSPHRRRRYSYSSSRSGSWSRSRSRSNSPNSHRPWRSRNSPRSSRHSKRERSEEVKRHKEKAIEERRVVYVGRIRAGMTRAELKERFSLYGEIEDCTLHFREHGDNYGFVTYYDTKDAFTAIENGSKLRRPNELPFDLCFGGRRQFCKTSYADLDSNREYDPATAKRKFDALDFDTLLKQAQKNLKR